MEFKLNLFIFLVKKSRDGSEWDVWITDASDSVCSVATAAVHRDAPHLKESVTDALTHAMVTPLV